MRSLPVRMPLRTACLTLFIAMFQPGGAADAGQLVYSPVNPSFGGSPFNGDYLLNNSVIQNDKISTDGGGGGGGGAGGDLNFPDFGDIFGDIDTVIGIDVPGDGTGDGGTSDGGGSN